jgi:hypothetical protein
MQCEHITTQTEWQNYIRVENIREMKTVCVLQQSQKTSKLIEVKEVSVWSTADWAEDREEI